MNPDIKYINKSKVRKTLSNVSFQEDLVYQAHSLSQPGFIPYVPKHYFDSLLEENEKLKKLLKTTEKSN